MQIFDSLNKKTAVIILAQALQVFVLGIFLTSDVPITGIMFWLCLALGGAPILVTLLATIGIYNDLDTLELRISHINAARTAPTSLETSHVHSRSKRTDRRI